MGFERLLRCTPYSVMAFGAWKIRKENLTIDLPPMYSFRKILKSIAGCFLFKCFKKNLGRDFERLEDVK